MRFKGFITIFVEHAIGHELERVDHSTFLLEICASWVAGNAVQSSNISMMASRGCVEDDILPLSIENRRDNGQIWQMSASGRCKACVRKVLVLEFWTAGAIGDLLGLFDRSTSPDFSFPEFNSC